MFFGKLVLTLVMIIIILKRKITNEKYETKLVKP